MGDLESARQRIVRARRHLSLGTPGTAGSLRAVVDIEPARSLLNHRVLHVMATPHGGSALSTIALIQGLAARDVPSSVVCMAMSRTRDADRQRVDEDRIREAVSGRAIFLPLYRWNRRVRAAVWERPVMAAGQMLLTGFTRRTGRQVATFAHDQGATVVHTNSLVTPDGRTAAARLGLPHVWHVREMTGPGEPFRFIGEGPRFARRLQRYPSSFVATSRIAASRFNAIAPGIDVEVVYNGLVLDGLLSLPPPTERQPIVVGMIANLSSRWKRHDLFIRAAALARQSVDARFVLIGSSSERDVYARDLHQLVDDLALSDCFSFIDHRSSPEAAIAEIDLLVHVADSESFGRVVVEAMAAGRAIVGTRGGGVGEIVDDGDTGLLAEIGDAAGVAQAIVRLVKSPDLRARMGQRGREVAQERYSVEAASDSMLDVYANAQVAVS